MRDLTEFQVQSLFAAIDWRDFFAPRDHAILSLLFNTGLRVGELIALTVQAVLSSNGGPRQDLIVVGKRKRRRVIPLNESARSAIAVLLRFNAQHGWPVTPDARLLFNRYRVPMSSRGVQLIFERLRKRAGLDVPASPHSCRHTVASKLMRVTHNLRLVQDGMGHARLNTVAVYVHPTRAELVAGFSKIG